jgi:protein-arginine kinase activator protein McsA
MGNCPHYTMIRNILNPKRFACTDCYEVFEENDISEEEIEYESE